MKFTEYDAMIYTAFGSLAGSSMIAISPATQDSVYACILASLTVLVAAVAAKKLKI